MRIFIPFAIICFSTASIVASTGSKTPSGQCTKSKGSICHIKSLLADSEVVLPDLSKRNELRITDGSLKTLTQAMASTMSDRMRTLKLEGLGMESIFILPCFENLHLANNTLSSIESTADAGSFAMKLLDVRNNQLTDVKQLQAFVHLEELYLDDNSISELEVDVLAKMMNLRVLSVARNKLIQVACTVTADPVFDNLEFMSFASNQLASICMGNWQLPLLKTLLLNNNTLMELQDLDSFGRFQSLEKLALGENRWNCAWLDQALHNVTAKEHTIDLNHRSAQQNCTFEQVAGICCQFTATGTEAVEVFVAEIEKTQKVLKLVDEYHEKFLRDSSETVKQFSGHVQKKIEELHAIVRGREPQTVTIRQVLWLRETVDGLAQKVSQLDQMKKTILEAEREQKRLLHFMIEMKNNLVRQAIETDNVLVLVDQERVDFDREVDEYLASKATATN